MKFEVYKDAKKDPEREWRWRLRASNGSDILADSGEGYANLKDCLHGISLVKGSDTAEAAVHNLVTDKTEFVLPAKMSWKSILAWETESKKIQG